MRPNVDREIPVPRWWLAREGPFLAERSTESIRSLGAGCALRNTTYRASDYAKPVGDYDLPLRHPRFVEWIGVPQSAGLIKISGGQWVNKLSRDQAVTAAVHLQRRVPSGPPHRGTDGSNGAVASILGSAAAPLE